MSTMTAGNAVEASPAQPQTTQQQGGDDFLQVTQPGRRQLYYVSGQAFGATISQPIPGVSGYYARLRLLTVASGGTGTAAVYQPDAPFSIYQFINFVDAFGTPVILGPGYEMCYLLGKFSKVGFGLGPASDPSNLPGTWSAGSTAGNFSFATSFPFEFLKTIGLISGANASLQPRLILTLAAESAVYSTDPTAAPTLAVNTDADFYWLPSTSEVVPPQLGTTQQWVYQPCSPTISSGAYARVAAPRLGGYLSALITEFRDGDNIRQDIYPSGQNRFRVYVDGIPMLDTMFSEAWDDMYIAGGADIPGSAGGVPARPDGVFALDRKTSLSQQDLGLFDTGSLFLSTSPGTLLEFEGAPWGTFTNTPGTLSLVLGQIIVSAPATSGQQGA